MTNYERILEYAKKNYEKMFREGSGELKNKFIVPGSMYSDSLWDWDCWLTNIALRQFVDMDISEYERGCVLNFLENMDEQGRIPIFITDKSKKPFFGKDSFTNIHKPCLAQHAAFIIKCNENDAEWLRPYFSRLLKFVDYYINNCRHKIGLYFWIDDNAIGVDNDPSTFYRPKCSSGSIYINCFMYKELEALCFIGELLGFDMSSYKDEQMNLKKAVQDYCYDEKDGMYYSVDLNLLPVLNNNGLHSGAPRHWDCVIERIGCWSGFLAMWSGIATKSQADRMVKENLLDENGFWAEYGVRTLSKYEKMYAIKKSGNPSCWLGPVWGVSNYMVFKGLVKYGYIKEAKILASKTIELLGSDIENSGELHEYYNPETGEPIMNPGFQNWNLLSINMGEWLNENELCEEF